MPILRLPFLYNAEIVKPRCRNPERFVVSDFAAFEIPETTSTGAPVSTRWVHGDSYAECEKPHDYFPNGPYVTVQRHWDGRQYRSMAADGGAPVTVGRFAASLETVKGRRPYGRSDDLGWSVSDYPLQPGYWRSHDKPRGCSTWGLRDLVEGLEEDAGRGKAKVKGDDRAARLAEAMELFPDRLLVIDGEMWTAQGVNEPHYHVDHFNDRVRLSVSMSPDDAAYLHVFRADRRDDALAWMGKLREEIRAEGREPIGSDATDVIEVVDPSGILLDDGVKLARQMISHVSRVSNRFQHRPAGEDVVRLWRALDALRDEPVAKSLDPTAEDLGWASRVIATCDALCTAADAEGDTHVDDTRRMKSALRRWAEVERDRRPDLVELATSPDPDEDERVAGFTM